MPWKHPADWIRKSAGLLRPNRMLPRNDSNKWYYGIVWVLLALIGLGPFGFPLLWKSPQFNLTWKVLLTILVTAGTVYLIAASWEI